MSKSRNNPLAMGLSGKLGKFLVFRQVGDQTVLAVPPRLQSTPPTEQQLAHRNKFRRASAYATMQLGDPDSKALYEAAAKRKKFKSARSLALADFFNAPDIVLIDPSAYTGVAGTKIVVHAEDDLPVKTLSVEVVNADGTLVEKGLAVQRGNSSVWVYTATVENRVLRGAKIIVNATDRPGNRTIKEVML